jgi:murein L,D-transpeptidase YcbB/YkuD
MGRKSLAYVVLAILLAIAVSGCQSMPKKIREEVSGMKTRVDTLETRVETVESKQASVERYAMEQNQAIEELKARRAAPETTNISVKPRAGRSKERTKDIQACLKNAGFYSGKIDGVKGKATKKAIREFQSANGLRVDGIVGKRTWELLSKYSSGGAFAPGGEEGTTK